MWNLTLSQCQFDCIRRFRPVCLDMAIRLTGEGPQTCLVEISLRWALLRPRYPQTIRPQNGQPVATNRLRIDSRLRDSATRLDGSTPTPRLDSPVAGEGGGSACAAAGLRAPGVGGEQQRGGGGADRIGSTRRKRATCSKPG